MNHKERQTQTPVIGELSARQQVSDHLTIESSRMAVIPTTREEEPLCYEFLCRGQNDEQVLVYINSETGMEEQILILIETDNGKTNPIKKRICQGRFFSLLSNLKK